MEVMIASYIVRVGLRSPLPTDPVELLFAVHSAHVTSIPFENFSVFLDGEVPLEVPQLFRKLVENRRGGYCFEHNLLACEMLRELGFEPVLRGARIILPGEARPLTHLVLEVAAGGTAWLFDVGYGGNGIRFPLRMDGQEQDQQFYKARLRSEETQWILEKLEPGATSWTPVYAVQKISFYPVDCLAANHFIATHPRSIFTQTITVQKFMENTRVMYRRSDALKRTVLTRAGEQTDVVDPEEALRDLEQNFGFQPDFLPEIAMLLRG